MKKNRYNTQDSEKRIHLPKKICSLKNQPSVVMKNFSDMIYNNLSRKKVKSFEEKIKLLLRNLVTHVKTLKKE